MLTLDETKAHLRVEIDDDDNLISTLIIAAYLFAENYTNRIINQDSKELKLESFDSVIQLPYLPVQSITSIAYEDTDDNAQVFADYYLDLRELFAKVMPDNDASWPGTNGDYENIVITYVAGYTSIPEQIDQAVLLIIGSLYAQRENHIAGVSIDTIPVSAEYLLNPYRVVSV